MTGFINKFKIPTLLGISVILFGIIAGVYLTLREQILLSQAAPNLTPNNITITNITDNSVAISWQTSAATTSFVTFGQNSPDQQTALEDKDDIAPKPRFIHYATLKNLLPKTTYQFKIISGKIPSDIKDFQTAPPLANQVGLTPIIGSILADDSPVNEGIVYLLLPGAIIQSALVKTGGNFLIPLSQIRKDNLSDYQPSKETTVKLTAYTDRGEASMLFNLSRSSNPLPPLKIGQNIDLTDSEETSPINQQFYKYDLNNDGGINAADYAIISSCFNKKINEALSGDISCAQADINKDSEINQKDLDLMNQKFEDLGVPAITSPE